jgi:hypothetical protein
LGCSLLVLACGRTPFEPIDPKADATEDDGSELPPVEDEPVPEPVDEPPPESCGNGSVEPGELCFDEHIAFASRIDPCSIDIGDLDGDGHLDVAVPNSDFDHLESPQNFASVLYGDGRGRLSSPLALLAGGDFAVGIAIGSLDADGLLDLVVANSDAGQINVLASAGGRAFGGPLAADVGQMPVTVVAADFDGDGFDDIAVTVEEDAGISVALGDGAGGLASPARFYAANGHTWGLAAADIDGDLDIDLVATDTENNRLAIWWGVGSGRSTSARRRPVSKRSTSTATA